LPDTNRPFHIEVLARGHERAEFSCGSPELDKYLQQQARQDTAKRVAAAFVLLEPLSPRVLGFYTLSASAVSADELPPDFGKRLPRYPQLPVVLLGRLAVDLSCRGRGAGEFLLMDALHRSLDASTNIGALAVIVDAKDDAAASFYRHFDFLALPGDSKRFFLPMTQIAELFPSA
jgi:GNAT superfamily N-acetyltransferase